MLPYSYELILAALVGMLVLVPLSWRNCTKLVLILVVFEGALRKWVFPQAADLLYFAKDALMLIAYAKYFVLGERGKPYARHDNSLQSFFLSSLVLVAVQVCNARLGTPIVGLVGGRNYLIYIPLMFMMRELFTSEKDLIKFINLYLLISLPVGLLAVLQHNAPADSMLNVYARLERSGTAMMGTVVRVTGTFSYVAGYAAYLQTMLALVIPLLVVEQPPFWRWSARFVSAFCFMSAFLTGSRGPVIAQVLFLVLYFILNRNFRELRLYKKLVFSTIICVLPTLYIMSSAITQFKERARDSSDVLPRIASSFTSPFESIEYAGLFGYGVGATYQASDVVRKMFHLPTGEKIPIFAENEPQRIMFELGPVGFLIWYGFRVALLVSLWRVYAKLRRPLLRELALTAFLVHLIALNGQMVFQITFMVYYWFLAGMIFLLPELEAREEQNANNASKQSARGRR